MKARFLSLWTVVVVAAALSFIVHLTVRFETVRLGYDVGKARDEQRALVEQRRLLSLEAATLRQADRVETVARGAFDMDVAAADRVIPMGKTVQRTSGRMQ